MICNFQAKTWMLTCSSFQSTSALSTGASTHPLPQPHGRQLCTCFWSSLHVAGWSQDGQKGLCPPNIGDLCSDHWLLLLTTDVQRKRWAGIVVVLPLTVASSPPHRLKCFQGDWKGQQPFISNFYFSLFPLVGARHWNLEHSKTTACMREIRKWLCILRVKNEKRTEKTLHLHIKLIPSIQFDAYNNWQQIIPITKAANPGEREESFFQSNYIIIFKRPFLNNQEIVTEPNLGPLTWHTAKPI